MKNSYFLLVCLLVLGVSPCVSQNIDGIESKHERWEYLLEDTGDVL